MIAVAQMQILYFPPLICSVPLKKQAFYDVTDKLINAVILPVLFVDLSQVQSISVEIPDSRRLGVAQLLGVQHLTPLSGVNEWRFVV